MHAYKSITGLTHTQTHVFTHRHTGRDHVQATRSQVSSITATNGLHSVQQIVTANAPGIQLITGLVLAAAIGRALLLQVGPYMCVPV